jgi:hypothetical protein
MFATLETMLTYSKNVLIDGNPIDPSSTDLIAQQINLAMGVNPMGDGWRILTGNSTTNLWGRLAYRFEIEDGK